MKMRIVNPTYQFPPGGYVTISCQMELLDDSDVLLSALAVSSIQPLSPKCFDAIEESFVRQFNDHIASYKALAGEILPLFPGTRSFDEAAKQFAARLVDKVRL